MSIGALSKATGVPADTLRTWERRYGFPAAERTESGHRRYSVQMLARLRLAISAIERGHRPADVLGADESMLRELLEAAAPELASEPNGEEAGDDARRWLVHVANYDGRALDRELARAASLTPGLDFLDNRVGPFLRELGLCWQRGDIDVAQEHFASERVRENLVRQWRPLSDAANGPLVVCATVGGERHVLGLHMAALALALHNARIVFLGAEAPPRDVARAAERHDAAAVVLSAAEGTDRAALADDVVALRKALAPGVPIVVGGRGFMPPLPGVVTLVDLLSLVDWLRAHGATASS